jgi:glucose-1-phosphate thymidylyltransferase
MGQVWNGLCILMTQAEVIGLVPMAGRGSRLAPLPCSKELYPVTLQPEGATRPQVVSEFLLRSMRHAGIEKAFLVIRDGKWDIPAYFNDGTALLDMHLAYLTARLPYGPAFSLDAAHPFVKHARVAMGFPDILFAPIDAFSQLLARQEETRADVVLGLFPMRPDRSDDTIDVGPSGQVLEVHLQQRVPGLELTWNVAVWTSRFTDYLHDHLLERLRVECPPPDELIVGHVLQGATRAGLTIQSVTFSQGRCLDIGTMDGLRRLPEFFREV